MASLDKLSLNNQIVLMRHDVRRAKLHTINKIMKEARRLKEKHGTEEQKNKYLKKSDRLIEEIKIIKDLKDDEISKFLLTHSEDLLSILNDPKTELKVKALAKVSMNKLLGASLIEFKKKYPNWNSEVPLLLPQLGCKKKNKSKRLKENGFVKKDMNLTSKNKISEVSDKKCVVNTPGNNGFLVELITKRHHPEESNDEGKWKIKKCKMNLNNSINKQNKMNKIPKNKNVELNISEPNAGKEQIKEDTKTDINSLENKEKLKVRKSETRVVDPFFMTSDDTEYLTVATSEKQIAALQNTSENEKYKNEYSSNFKEFRGGKNISGLKKFGNSDNKFHSKKINHKSNYGEKRDFNHKLKKAKDDRWVHRNDLITNQNNEEKLHPSWEAKKRQSSLTQFSGKKIVFNDDD